jgi:hypothetical protein
MRSCLRIRAVVRFAGNTRDESNLARPHLGTVGMKTARFSEVVARSGRPEVHLTWTAPAADRVLQAAAEKSRVMTVHQQVRGTKKDSGVVGIEEGRDAQFLIFPKSLRPFVGRRIVGLRYELLAEGLSTGSKGPEERRKGARPQPAVARRPKVPDTPRPAAQPTPVRLPEPPARRQPKPLAFEPASMESDPIRAGIRRALTDLSVGDVTKAKRRLMSLLRD